MATLVTRGYQAPGKATFRDEAFIRYHTNEAYLRTVETQFGFNVRQHIEKMNKIHMRRWLLEENGEDDSDS